MVISSIAPVAFCLSSSSTMKPPTFPAPMIAKLLKLDIMLVGKWMKRVLSTLVGGWAIFIPRVVRRRVMQNSPSRGDASHPMTDYCCGLENCPFLGISDDD